MEKKVSVRGKAGLLPWIEHQFTLPDIKAWREAQHVAALPDTLDDFYLAHGLCPDCQGHGVRVIGWSEPQLEEVEQAESMGLEELPVYGPCQTCGGTGRSTSG